MNGETLYGRGTESSTSSTDNDDKQILKWWMTNNYKLHWSNEWGDFIRPRHRI